MLLLTVKQLALVLTLTTAAHFRIRASGGGGCARGRHRGGDHPAGAGHRRGGAGLRPPPAQRVWAAPQAGNHLRTAYIRAVFFTYFIKCQCSPNKHYCTPQVIYFDRYQKLLAPTLDPFRDVRIRGQYNQASRSKSINGTIIDVEA